MKPTLRFAAAPLFAAILALPVNVFADAEFKFASVCSDNMVVQRDVAAPVWGFGEPGAKVSVALNGKKVGETTVDEKGRWTVRLPPQKANTKPCKIAAKCGAKTVAVSNVLFGDVWFGCGQSNMAFAFNSFGWKAIGAREFVAKAKNPSIRTLHMNEGENRNALVPREDALGIKWETASPESVAKFSAALYWMGDKLHKELGVPIGLIDASWGATSIQTWLDGDYSAQHGERHAQLMGRRGCDIARNPAGAKLNPGTVCSMHNGLVAPLYPMAIKGAVWYQGCSNVGFDSQWRQCIEAILGGWRAKFTYKDKLPVILTCIAPHNLGSKPDSRGRIANGEAANPTWSVEADMRLAAVECAAKMPDCSFVSLLDLGEDDIHPVRKEEVGERWCKTALQNFYGKPIQGTSPSVASAEYKGGKVILTLRNAKGLKTRDGKAPAGFEIASAPGANGKVRIYKANAKIVGETVELSSPEVTDAFAYRYAWFDLPLGWNVVNGAGLPLDSARGYKDGKWHDQEK